VLHNPARVDVAEAPARNADGAEGAAGGGAGDDADAADGGVLSPGRVSHALLRCDAKDKLLHVMALLRLSKVRRKALIFASSADAAVRLRLFLERFGVRAGSLHGALPANSRAHVLAEFNKGLFDFLIATDDAGGSGGTRTGTAAAAGVSGHAKGANKHAAAAAAKGKGKAAAAAEPEAEEEEGGEGEEGGGGKRRGGGGAAKDAEFGVTRGIDFKDVRTVINMDVPVRFSIPPFCADADALFVRCAFFAMRADGSRPCLFVSIAQTSLAAYVHRVGRTGRAGASGAALTLASPSEAAALAALESALAARAAGAASDAPPPSSASAPATFFAPYTALSGDAVEALRYRADDAARACGRNAVREARLRELRGALLNSERLTAHFEDNPAERALLQADAPLAKSVAAPHLKHLPAYLRGGAMGRKRPRGSGAAAGGADDAAAAGAAGEAAGAAGAAGAGGDAGAAAPPRPTKAAKAAAAASAAAAAANDPLKSFSLSLAAKAAAAESGNGAPGADAAAAAMARSLWSKAAKKPFGRGRKGAGNKGREGGAGGTGGTEWPARRTAQMRKGKLNVRRGKRKTGR
jgi:ATP-dependent RNA helicase DDX56/DBP9